MESAAAPLLLKVLSGPHVGAEVALSEGETIIGSGDQSDLILNDALVAPKHLRLEIKGTNARVQSLAEDALLDGQPLNGQAKDMAHFQLLTLGGTHLMIGPRGGQWPAAKSLLLPHVGSRVTAPEAPANAAASASKPGEKTEQSGKTKPLPNTLSREPVSPQKRRMHLALVALGLLILIGSLVLASRFQTSVEAPVPIRAIEKVKAAISDLGFGERLNASESNGKITVQGYVETPADKARVTAALAGLREDNINVRVFSQQQLVEDARNLLRALNVNVELSPAEPGILTARGIVPSRDVWTQALAHLKEDLSGLKSVRDGQVITPGEIVDKATELLDERGMAASQIRPEWTGGVLVLRGITPEHDAVWNGFRDRFVAMIGFPVEVRDEMRAPNPAAAVAAAAAAVAARAAVLTDNVIESITVDVLSWVVLKNGKRVFAGALLPNGCTVESIAPDSVTISDGVAKRVLHVGDDLWTKP